MAEQEKPARVALVDQARQKPPAQLFLIPLVLLAAALALFAGAYLYFGIHASPTVTPTASPTAFVSPVPAAVTPALPASNELFEVYKRGRAAVVSRDYDSFYAMTSSRRRFFYDNPESASTDARTLLSNETGIGSSGLLVQSPIVFDGREIFRQTAPYEMMLNAPQDSSDIVCASPALFIPPSGGVAYATMACATTPNATFEGTASIRFDYEDGSWRYAGEWWTARFRSPRNAGDAPAATDHKIIGGPRPGLFSVLRIRAGDSVTWVNATGMILSYAGTGEPWNSEYLYLDNYTRVFAQKGLWMYYWNSDRPSYYYESRGAIVVE